MKRIDFNQGWTFYKEKDHQEYIVNLPHDAMLTETRDKEHPTLAGGAYFDGGVYHYIKKFFMQEEWNNKSIYLECEGIYQKSKIILNGELINEWPYGYTQFYTDLSAKLIKDGENVLEIIADNTKIPNSRWYSGAGIYREVALYIGESNHIDPEGVQITTLDKERIQVHTEIEGGAIPHIEIWEGDTLLTSADGKTAVLTIPEAKHWSDQSPYLYTCNVSLRVNEKIVDEMSVSFGMRTLEYDKSGLRVNGKTVLLRGACIHHDNGVLGACCFRDAEYRRVKKLKEAGFNAVRSAHNPISKAFLDACDQYGVYVMDETFDYWLIHKNSYDYAKETFHEWWRKDTEAMVRKDYNHPSVIMYSIGNEISELGTMEGQELCKEIGDCVKKMDATRPVTCGINLMLASMASKGGGIYKDDGKESKNGSAGMDNLPTSTFFNIMMNRMGGVIDHMASTGGANKVADKIEACLDIMGYNYATSRYLKENKAHPDRVFVGSETLPQKLYKNWQLVKKIPGLIGDFMWTGWDYLGESGIGTIRYQDKTTKENIDPGLMISSGAGVIDICGYEHPEVEWNKTIWGLTSSPTIAVEPVCHADHLRSASMWRTTDAVSSWSWSGYEGKKTDVIVYSDAHHAVLFVNDKKTAQKSIKECKAIFKNVTYESGTLKAEIYDSHNEKIGETVLKSAVGKTEIALTADHETLRPNGQDLCYVDIQLVGEDGILKSTVDTPVTVTVEGNATLQGLGSARPNTEQSFLENTYTTYYGKMLAVVRAGYTPGTVKVHVSAEGLEEQTLTLSIK